MNNIPYIGYSIIYIVLSLNIFLRWLFHSIILLACLLGCFKMQKVKISRWGSPKICYYTKLSHCKRNWDFSCKIVAPRNFFVFNGDFGGFQWGNFQNSEFAYYASKSGKCIKQTPTPPFSKTHFRAPENGTSSARIKKLRPLFHANIPPKWWSRCLFYSFTTFGRVIGKF